MTIEKLKSGSYRIRKMCEGKLYTVTVDHKPSEKEVVLLLSKKMGKLFDESADLKITFSSASMQYILMKKNVLSPTTVKEYKSELRQLPEWFTSKTLDKITQQDVQKCINELAETRSPKTVRNYHGFIQAVLGFFINGYTSNARLPQKVKNEPYIPTDEEVKIILDNAKDTEYEIPIKLACYGLRLSEIIALRPDDIDENGIVHVRGAMVKGENGYVRKTTKTVESRRDIPIDDKILIGKIKSQGYVFKQAPGTIGKFLRRTERKYGMETFSIHKLRHYFASKLMSAGVPQKDIMYLGGWSSPYTLERIYQHKMKSNTEEQKRNIMKTITGIWE